MKNIGNIIKLWIFRVVSYGFLGVFIHPQIHAAVKPINALPAVKRIWLGTESGIIVPLNEEHYRSLNTGYITILKPHLSQLKKGEHWATLEAKQLELNDKNLELTRQKIHHAIQKLEEERGDLIESVNLEIEELETKKLALLQALEETEISPNLSSRIIAASEKISRRIKRLEDKINPEKLELDFLREKEELELDLERKEIESLRQKRKSILKAPFDCVLEIADKEHFASAHQGEPIWIESSKLYATLIDRSSYSIHFTNRNPILAAKDLSKLMAMVETGTRAQLIKADFEETQRIDAGSSIKVSHVFKILKESQELAKFSVNEKRAALIFKKLPPGCHIIHKKNIALLEPEILAARGWNGLVKHLWPQAKIVEVGPQTIAVKALNAN